MPEWSRSRSTGRMVKRPTSAGRCSIRNCSAAFPTAPGRCWARLGLRADAAGRSGETGRNIGETFTAIRRECERDWGCRNLELPVSRLAQTEAFAHFARHILGDLPRFRDVYNAAIRAYRAANHIRSHNHPAPLLAEGEAPFWVRTSACRRERATADSDVEQPPSPRPHAHTLRPPLSRRLLHPRHRRREVRRGDRRDHPRLLRHRAARVSGPLRDAPPAAAGVPNHRAT